MLRVPVISAVGHERDSTLIDDVAAVACSTPTHAAEAAVPLDCLAARREPRALRRARCGGRRRGRSAPAPATWSPWPAGRRGRCGASALALNQKTREIRAASERGLAERRRLPAADRRRVVLERARRRAPPAPDMERAGADGRCAGAAVALRAHEPERTLERGYALAETPTASR